jgi:hypothetical protein
MELLLNLLNHCPRLHRIFSYIIESSLDRLGVDLGQKGYTIFYYLYFLNNNGFIHPNIVMRLNSQLLALWIFFTL